MYFLRLRLRLLRRQWLHFYDSIWFFPVLMGLGALGLFYLTHQLDQAHVLQHHWKHLPGGFARFFAGDAGSAQTLLSWIAGMWATIIGISFSVTLVTVQLTATKYIAQVLPLFERNNTNQVVLGTYLATVIYALLELRTVRTAPPVFVPHIGVNVALLLAIVALFELILFISNTINFVRPTYFLELMTRDTLNALPKAIGPVPRDGVTWIERVEQEPIDLAEGCPILAPQSGTLTDIGWEALVFGIERELRGSRRGGRWCVHLHHKVGDRLERGQPLGIVVGPGPCAERQRVITLVRLAHEIQRIRRHRDDPEYGIEALAGMTIKGTAQADLDVAFEGIDFLFELLPAIAKQPPGANYLRIAAGANEVVIYRPIPDLMGKFARELTMISESALPPNQSFRPLVEGISQRLITTMIGLAEQDEWDAFDRILPHLTPWYQSAFYHMNWIYGMRRLAANLVDLAEWVHESGHPGAFERVLVLMLEVRDRLAPDSQAHEAFQEAFGRLAREIELPRITLMPVTQAPIPDA